VAVGSACGVHSSVWRIWTAKNRPDVYIASRSTAGTLKTSLHESGAWQHSLLSQVAMQYVERNAERHLDKWERPLAFGGGWRRGYYIIVPRTELRQTSEDVDEVRFAEDPGPGYWVSIEIVLAEPGTETTLAFEAGMVLGSLRLSDGGGVAIVAIRHRPDPAAAQFVRRAREGILEAVARGEESVRSVTSMESPVFSLFGIQSDGTHGVIEVSLTLPPPEVRVICTGSAVADGPLAINWLWTQGSA
jgi:hypothetical protein